MEVPGERDFFFFFLDNESKALLGGSVFALPSSVYLEHGCEAWRYSSRFVLMRTSVRPKESEKGGGSLAPQ